jgi:hypothetical protein
MLEIIICKSVDWNKQINKSTKGMGKLFGIAPDLLIQEPV